MPFVRIVALKESADGELRAALTPQGVSKLVKMGAQVAVEAGIGEGIKVPDDAYTAAGAETLVDRARLLAEADMLLGVRPPTPEIIAQLRPGAVLAAFLDPFFNLSTVELLRTAGVSALCMELVPRTSYAQKMDALSSQASLAGYAAVIIAAERSVQAFPMMSTPAGTIQPAKVFVLGAGVAGLQAIATARRLGARVEAYDTRPVVKEQVQSLGARFVEIDVGETGQTAQGYAQALSDEQLEMQRQQMAKVTASSDVVITTAQVFGRSAPKLLTAEMVAGMRPGSVIVDLAASSGGNVSGTVPGAETLTDNGVLIVGLTNYPGEVARDASLMYSNNLTYLIEHMWDKEAGRVAFDLEDETVAACLLTHEGAVRDERVRNLLEGAA